MGIVQVIKSALEQGEASMQDKRCDVAILEKVFYGYKNTWYIRILS